MTNREKSSIIVGQPTNGPLVKRLRRGPLKAETWVRFPYGSPPTESTTEVVLFLFLSVVDPYAHQTQRTCKVSKSIFLICLICKSNSALRVRKIAPPLSPRLGHKTVVNGVINTIHYRSAALLPCWKPCRAEQIPVRVLLIRVPRKQSPCVTNILWCILSKVYCSAHKPRNAVFYISKKEQESR